MNLKTILNRLYIISVLLLSSCAVQQTQLQSELIPPDDSVSTFVLQKTVTMRANNATPTKLRADTTWSKVGDIEQGTVYRTKDQVVVVNSFDVHEGYIVVQDDSVVGYYLPVEKTFVKSKPALITLTKKEMDNED